MAVELTTLLVEAVLTFIDALGGETRSEAAAKDTPDADAVLAREREEAVWEELIRKAPGRRDRQPSSPTEFVSAAGPRSK